MKTASTVTTVILFCLLFLAPPLLASPKAKPAVEKKTAQKIWHRVGHGLLMVRSFHIGIVAEVGLFGGSEHSAHRLGVVRIKIKNPSAGRILEYRPYFESGSYSVEDNFGNNYKPVDCSGYPVGQIFSKKRIYPGKTVEDLLIFQRPVKNARTLSIRLKERALGGRSFTVIIIRLHPHKATHARNP
jgi:hypothetical protein